MYTEYFGLKSLPFNLTPDPQFAYLSETHQTVLNLMISGFENNHKIIVLSGEIGTGKTTLIRVFRERLAPHIRVAIIFHTLLKSSGLLKCICHEFGIQTKNRKNKELIRDLADFVLECSKRKEKTLLIIDEAQNLKSDVLEQIRSLSGICRGTNNLLPILLVGQPELKDHLQKPANKRINENISMRFELEKMTRSETTGYIEHRIRAAGYKSSAPLFASAAISEVFFKTGGTPRLINILCDKALLTAYVENASEVTDELITNIHEDEFGELPGESNVSDQPGKIEQEEKTVKATLSLKEKLKNNIRKIETFTQTPIEIWLALLYGLILFVVQYILKNFKFF